jgi:hypothetical protein
VTTLGYIRATYCKRGIEDLFTEIETYAERGQKDNGLVVEGIFVDETVNLYSEHVKRYLDTVDQKVKNSFGCKMVCRW